jgi:hypothetical protein
MPLIEDLFDPKKGSGEYLETLDEGKTPIVSSTTKNNGIVGFVDLEPRFKAPCISIDRVTGQAFVQLFDFVTVPDDVSVLVPKEEMSIEKMMFVSSIINQHKWRFSYGRKLTRTRLKKIFIDFSLMPKFNVKINPHIPSKKQKDKVEHNTKFKSFNITKFFKPLRGDFHALDRLNPGEYPTISRTTEDSGIVGYYDKPDGAKVYPKLWLTVSTTTGDSFVQLKDFIATDNVVILKPKSNFKVTTLFFFQLMINWTKWRYSYGRQCYKTKFESTNIYMPVDKKGEIDEKYIEKVVKNSYGWDVIENNLN